MGKILHLLIACFIAWTVIHPESHAEASNELTIYYSNDVRGEIEPCG